MKRKLNVTEIRGAFCLFFLLFMFFVATLRIMAVINEENYSAAAKKQSSYRLTVTRLRGTIFDTNMKSLTNQKQKIYTAITPTDEGKNTMSKYLSLEEMRELSKKLSDGKPVLFETEKEIKGEGVLSISVPVCQDGDTLAPHLLGYLDGDGHGVSGLQKTFDDLLYSESTIDFLYACDAKGDLLSRFSTETVTNERITASGVKTTIDADIQRIAEEVMKDFKSGALLVAEVGTGKIRALVSRPDFNPTTITDYLEDESSPLLNRAFCAYNVGSVFKPCVAAAALEKGGLSNLLYNCTGGKVIGGKNFACHNLAGHGTLGIADAIAFSCNTYFYNLGQKAGSGAVCSMANSLFFGQRHTFYNGFYTEKGYMPTEKQIQLSEQTLANTVIGQGDVMLTPVSLLTLYEAIANGGEYVMPSLIEGIVKNGAVEEITPSPTTKVMSEKTAEILKKALAEVIRKGTGKAAAPTVCTAAGKTATAQTGWKVENKAVNHSWFCGFFPAENPRYVAVIISENTSGGGTPCPPVFSALADAVYTLKLS
ncbi:MAG: penicillin-binding protein 2 [Clostridia bacterium]|nr:penicillin-binding protein 2 [Clostridia bacterium]MBQ5798831.1 penicillin-binding protein 2 [Clostridia bacterium]MEE1278950.1 penicillin-binding transpeptidase domain-containing protein [Acutalibacteraceae bacterium]